MKFYIALLSFFVFCSEGLAQRINVYTEHFPPYQIRISPKKVVGVSSSFVKELLDKTELDYRIHVLPWYRSYHNALREQNSLLYSVARTEEREHLFHWLMPLCDIEVSFFWKKNQQSKNINSLDAAKKFVIAVASGQPSELFLKENGFTTDKNLVILASHEQGLGLLQKDRVDAIFAADRFIKNLSQEIAYKDLEMDKYTIKALSKKLYLVANTDSDEEFISSIKASVEKVYDQKRFETSCHSFLN